SRGDPRRQRPSPGGVGRRGGLAAALRRDPLARDTGCLGQLALAPTADDPQDGERNRQIVVRQAPPQQLLSYPTRALPSSHQEVEEQGDETGYCLPRESGCPASPGA